MTSSPNLCTLFDQTYLPQGRALLASIRQHEPDARLYVLALDEPTRWAIQSLHLPNMWVISLKEFETDQLKRLRQDRTHTEYCWTLPAFLTATLLADFDLPHIAYIDADCFLFDALAPLYDEVQNAELAIIPHRFPARLRWRETANGIYNVGWVFFRNTQKARQCLQHWCQQVANQCSAQSSRDTYARLRFGDQGYLDTWPEQYGAHVVQHLGANLAPWNQEQYLYQHIEHQHGLNIVRPSHSDPLLFYHFHGHRFQNTTRSFHRGGYPIARMVEKFVYTPYEHTLLQIHDTYSAGPK